VGLEATAVLTSLVRGRELRCEGDKRDRYHRPLVRCWIGDLDVGRAMVRQGWAVAEFGMTTMRMNGRRGPRRGAGAVALKGPETGAKAAFDDV
jgi:endonuclease YncB( thermonuclease family)